MRSRWQIRCYDSKSLKWEIDVPFSQMSEPALEECLRTLCATEQQLTPSEVVGSFLNGRAGKPHRLRHLELQRSTDYERRRTVRTCGGNPHLIAVPINEQTAQ